MTPNQDHPDLFASCLLVAIFTLLASAAGAIAQQPGGSPVKIFIMAGQSNMQGHGEMAPATTQGTLGYTVANDPAGDYQFASDGAGGWSVRDDVWIHYERSSSTLRAGNLTAGYGAADTTIGPELGFGSVIGEHYGNQVLLLKTAWGGKSLAVDFRPPSSGWSVNPPVAAGDQGFYYNEILRLVEEVTTNLGTYFPGYDGQGFEITGIGWHQGWNDRVNQAHNDEYEVNMANFIRDIRIELGIPDLPFVIATTGMSGWNETHPRALSLMAAQLAVAQYPEFQDNVFTVETRGFYREPAVSPSPGGNQAFHWNRNAATHLDIGVAMGEAMLGLATDQCPSDLGASGGPGGVTLTWSNGDEMPDSVRILRDSVEIASAAPVDPPTFSDPGAVPGSLQYELIFTMPGDPCDPLALTFDGGITDLEATQTPGGIRLDWVNNLAYDAIEVRRNGALLEAALSGTAETFTDPSSPAGGLVTYSVVPTNGSAVPTELQIDLNGLPTGGAVVYEPFDYPAGGLDGAWGFGETGLDGPWNAKASTLVTTGSLTYGGLPVAGGKLSDFSGGQNHFGGARSIPATALANRGLLDDGATLWFSVLVGFDAGADVANSRLALALANSSFNDGDFSYWIDAEGAQAGSGLGLTLGTTGASVATEFRDLTFGDGISGNRNGRFAGVTYGEDEYGLIVGKITWGATSDFIALYQPGTDLVLPASLISSLPANVDQATYDTITIARSDMVVLDEIRFGASYEDVTGAGTDATDYDNWAANYPGADLADPDGDHDGDGVANDEERIWGLDPTDASSVDPYPAPLDPGAGTLSYTRRDPALSGLTYTVWTSSTLEPGSWTEDAAATASQEPGPPDANDVQTVTVILSASPVDGKLFVQIRAAE